MNRGWFWLGTLAMAAAGVAVTVGSFALFFSPFSDWLLDHELRAVGKLLIVLMFVGPIITLASIASAIDRLVNGPTQGRHLPQGRHLSQGRHLTKRRPFDRR